MKKGFISFDLLFCALPLLIMISLLLNQVSLINEAAQLQGESVQEYSKLLSIADYALKQGGALKEDQQGGQFSGSALYRPSVIDDYELSQIPSEEIRSWMGFESLHIGWDKGEGTCVYRIALRGDEVKKLYVCGK
ncbi:hypothetical protein JW721_01075 [Candidatus Micrarchaeota archaeon]|nr:hypothetical protein [Candidatus Micrarchaeota archaeon]